MRETLIWHITTGGDRGGAKTHLLTLLPRLNSERCRVKLICLNGGPLAAEAGERGLAVDIYPMAGAWDLSVIFRLAAAMRREKVDIVHTHGVRANFCGRLAARHARVPHVLTTVHSLVSLDYQTGWQNALSGLAEKITAPLTDRFIAVSDALRQKLTQGGTPSRKIAVIRNGIDTGVGRSPDSAAVAAVRLSLGITPAERLVGVVGRLVPVKAYDDFLTAAARIGAVRADVKFLVTGDGPGEEALREQARALGITGRVVFAGFRRDVPLLLAGLDVFVISSVSEGLPLVLLEAMAAGRPVVCTAVGGIPEVVTDGENGLLVPARDPAAIAAKVLTVLADAELARSLGTRARTAVRERFDAAGQAAALEELYRDVIGQAERS
ncbi:MAG: glycosyltransferase [bacterium]